MAAASRATGRTTSSGAFGDLGCDQAQGYLFARRMAATGVAGALARAYTAARR